MAVAVIPRGRRVPTPGALRVVAWHLATYKRLWRLNLLSSFAQPMLYLLGLGVGVGSLVDRNAGSGDVLGGVSYVAYVAPGLLVTAAMAVCSAESMWPVMGSLTWSRGYHGIAATPLTAGDIVAGHATWMAIRSGIAGTTVALALALFDDTRSWGLVPTVAVSMGVGVAFAMPIMAYSITSRTDGAFAAIQRFLIIPLFLFGGAFYPLSQLPDVVQWLAKAFPLWHGVVVARSFTVGDVDVAGTIGHLAVVTAWALVGTLVAVRNLRARLYP